MTSKQACLILAAIAATGGVAQARPMHVVTESDGTTAVRVQTSDVDLASDSGARTMWVRLQEAAHDDCGQSPSLTDLEETAALQGLLERHREGRREPARQPEGGRRLRPVPAGAASQPLSVTSR